NAPPRASQTHHLKLRVSLLALKNRCMHASEGLLVFRGGKSAYRGTNHLSLSPSLQQPQAGWIDIHNVFVAPHQLHTFRLGVEDRSQAPLALRQPLFGAFTLDDFN